MAGSDPADAAAWMRMANEMLAEMRLQREQVLAPMARSNENMSKAQADLAAAQRVATEKAAGKSVDAVAPAEPPRTSGGVGPDDRSAQGEAASNQ